MDIPAAIPEEEGEEDISPRDLDRQVADTVLGGVEDDALSLSDGDSTIDSRGNFRNNSVLARANSFMAEEQRRGRVPSVCAAEVSTTLQAMNAKPANKLLVFGGVDDQQRRPLRAVEEEERRHPPKQEEEEQQQQHPQQQQQEEQQHHPQQQQQEEQQHHPEQQQQHHPELEEERDARPESSETGFGGLSEAQMRLLGVGGRDELRRRFEEVLRERQAARRDARASKPPGPCAGRATVEALVDAMLDRQQRPGISMNRVDELANRPEKTNKSTSDRNCTFAPRTRNRKALEIMRQCGYDFVDKEHDADAFVDRLSRNEKMRRKKLEHARGKAEYDARLDKKMCPRCGATQTYDEVVEKRYKCQDCSAAYRRPRPPEALDDWLDAQAERQRRKADALQAARDQEQYQSSDNTRSGRNAYQRALRAKLDAEAGAFLDRVSRDIERRARTAKERQEVQSSTLVAPRDGPSPTRRKRPFAKPAVVPVVSKWEDDLEAYVRWASTKRQHDVDRKRQIAESAAARRDRAKTLNNFGDARRRASTKLDATVGDHSRGLHHKRKPHKERPSSPTVDLHKFDDLLRC